MGYKERLKGLRHAAEGLESYLEEELAGTALASRIDYISARAKTPESFAKKATRYRDPLEDIQDQVGVRIVVFYLSDVAPVRDFVKKFFHIIEDTKAGVSGTSVFGYEAWHCIVQLPPHIKADTGVAVDFFELQISTLFQHAWAQANHDLAYKGEGALPDELKRDAAWAAAQAYGADKIFDRMLQTLRQ